MEVAMEILFFVAIIVLMIGEWVSAEVIGQAVLFFAWFYVVIRLGHYIFARFVQGRKDARDPFGFD